MFIKMFVLLSFILSSSFYAHPSQSNDDKKYSSFDEIIKNAHTNIPQAIKKLKEVREKENNENQDLFLWLLTFFEEKQEWRNLHKVHLPPSLPVSQTLFFISIITFMFNQEIRRRLENNHWIAPGNTHLAKLAFLFSLVSTHLYSHDQDLNKRLKKSLRKRLMAPIVEKIKRNISHESMLYLEKLCLCEEKDCS